MGCDTVIDGVNVSGGGGRVFLGTFPATSQATLDINSVISDDYEKYAFEINLRPALDDRNLFIRVSNDNGATFPATNYRFVNHFMAHTTDSLLFYRTGATAQMEIGSGTALESFGNAAVGGAAGEIRLERRSSYPSFTWSITGAQANGGIPLFVGTGANIVISEINAVQFLFETGDIASGSVTVHGIAGTI